MRLSRVRLERGHRSLLYDLRQSRRLEILLPRLLLRVMLPRVLLDALQLMLLLSIVVRIMVKELRTLFSRVQHILRRIPVPFTIQGSEFKVQSLSFQEKIRDENYVATYQRSRKTYPNISTIRVIWLYSLVPGNSGNPRKSSTAIHPKDHMSMAAVYGIPSRTSGDL